MDILIKILYLIAAICCGAMGAFMTAATDHFVTFDRPTVAAICGILAAVCYTGCIIFVFIS